jgi:hemerythrin-like domain-containing protein
MLNMNRRHLLRMMGVAIAVPHITYARAAETEKEKEIEAAEDLMREHGILRRALLVYAEAASRLSTGTGELPVSAVHDAAALFRTFGEEYHERSLEERHVFPILIKGAGPNAALSNVLKQQHARGREITQYISAVTARGRVASADAGPFGHALTSFVRMYEHHAAIEDTIIFPAWKAAISESQYHELSEEFEELERKMFGKDGFDDAVTRIGKIEQAFGLADLAQLTAPPPPKIAV